MQSEFHETCEAYPAAAGCNFAGNQFAQSRAVGEGVGGRLG